MILQVNGTSWVGFGWRPKKLTADCRKFPVVSDPVTEPSSEPSSEAASIPEPSSEPASKPEPSSEAASIPEPSSEAASTPEPQSEPSSTAEPQSEPSSTAEPQSEPESEPESSKKSEPLALGSSKSKRVAAPTEAIEKSVELPKIPASKDEYTVSTSVSYRVSSSTGRRRRAAEKGKIKFPIEFPLFLFLLTYTQYIL